MKNNNNNKSNLFLKKLNREHKIIPLNMFNFSSNETKHFPSTVREWYDSYYSYKNSTYTSFIWKKNLISFIKGYFYMYYNNKRILNIKNRSVRLKRLSLKRIFVSKMEFKHTSDKVNITMYIYNEEKRILIRKLRILMNLILKANKIDNIRKNNSGYLTNKLFFLNKQQKYTPFVKYLKVVKDTIILKLDNQQNKLNYSNVTSNKIIRNNTNKLLYLLYLYNNVIYSCASNKELLYKYNNVYKGFIRKIYLEKEIKLLNYYKLLLILNKNKFKDYFLSRLRTLVSKFFNKRVDFNIINQKSPYLNSDIFTEAILIKLRNRKNRLLRVLKRFFNTVKIPKINKIYMKESRVNTPYIYKINNLNYNNDKNDDLLNNLLFNNLNDKSYIEKEAKNYKDNNSLENKLLDSLKYKNIAGIRLEAKGRLTRRFTASRSVFKVRWKGSIRNIDSSYKGLSSVMLRGHLRSNLQYSLMNSTTRNGAFGLKGWISGN